MVDPLVMIDLNSFLVVRLCPLAVMMANGWRFDTPPTSVAAGAATGVLLWGGTLKLLHHPLLEEVDVLRRRYRGLIGRLGAS